MQSRQLFGIVFLVPVFNFVGAGLAIVNQLPYEFGGKGDPSNVARDFGAGGGTALSAPLAPQIALVVFLFLSRAIGRLGTIAIVGIALSSLLFLIAGAQEPILRRTLASMQLDLIDICCRRYRLGRHRSIRADARFQRFGIVTTFWFSEKVNLI